MWRPNGKRRYCFSIKLREKEIENLLLRIGAPGFEKLTMALKCENKISSDL